MPGSLTAADRFRAPPQSRGGWWWLGRRPSIRISVRPKTKWWTQLSSLNLQSPSLLTAGVGGRVRFRYVMEPI